MKKLLSFALLCFVGLVSSAQIPTSLQGKYRGFNQQGNKINITTTVILQANQMLITFGIKEMAFNIEKTWEAGVYKIKSMEKDEWRYMKVYMDKNILHLVWYNICDGRSVDEDFRFKREA